MNCDSHFSKCEILYRICSKLRPTFRSWYFYFGVSLNCDPHLFDKGISNIGLPQMIGNGFELWTLNRETLNVSGLIWLNHEHLNTEPFDPWFLEPWTFEPWTLKPWNLELLNLTSIEKNADRNLEKTQIWNIPQSKHANRNLETLRISTIPLYEKVNHNLKKLYFQW